MTFYFKNIKIVPNLSFANYEFRMLGSFFLTKNQSSIFVFTIGVNLICVCNIYQQVLFKNKMTQISKEVDCFDLIKKSYCGRK